MEKSFTILNKQSKSNKNKLTEIEKDTIKKIDKIFGGVIPYVK